jgi:hypothetical protein
MIFTEPHGGVDFTNEQFTPAHVNAIVNSERSIYLAMLRQKLTSNVTISTATVRNEWCWSNHFQAWIRLDATTGRLVAFTDSGKSITCDTTVLSDYASGYSGIVGTHETADGLVVEVFPGASTDSAWSTSNGGTSWVELISAATLAGNMALSGGNIWLGGANHVRLQVVSTSAPVISLLCGQNASTYTSVAVPGNTTGADGRFTSAHNGTGTVALKPSLSLAMWIGVSYGTLAANWSKVTAPTAGVGTCVQTIAYDDERDLWILFERDTSSSLPNEVRFTTSANLADWQAWRVAPWTYSRASFTGCGDCQVKSVGGVWFVTNRHHLNDVNIWYEELWFSIDGGASWTSCGQIGHSSVYADGYIKDTNVATSDNGRLLILCDTMDTGELEFTRYGPFETPVPVASTAH